jgi:glycerol uptake facilitator-like aquaporin
MSLSRRLASEAVGTALLLACVVGSGLMGERLAGGNVAIALLANTVATGAVLVALILTFGSISAHFNPAVTLVEAWRGTTAWSEVPAYVAAEFVGAILGVVVAHLMFELPIVSLSQHTRSGPAQMLSEFVATFGLLSVIIGVSRNNRQAVPFAVGAYITAAYWFTASTSFANPAVTLARSLSDTFAGIRPSDVPGFLLAQLGGAGASAAFFGWLAPEEPRDDERSDPREVMNAGSADLQRPVSLHRKLGA